MNVLLLTSHSIAEYDDLRMLSDLGYDVFSIGAYSDPANPGDDKRPALPDAPAHPDLAALCHVQRERHADEPADYVIDWAKADLHPDVIDWADTIICHHFLEPWIADQWERIRHKRVIWRTCGQSNPWLEMRMGALRGDGLQIIRYSPAERRHFERIGAFAGEDAMIRFGKYPDEYVGWTGVDPIVITVAQDLAGRGDALNYGFWRDATSGLRAIPIGPNSERIGGPGSVSYHEMIAWLHLSRAYLYTGTIPASYTLGLMEAMLAGIPVVSIGPEHMPQHDLFEGHEITRLWTDDVPTARTRLRALLEDWDYARAVGEGQQARARSLFGIDKVAAQWRDFLGAPAKPCGCGAAA